MYQQCTCGNQFLIRLSANNGIGHQRHVSASGRNSKQFKNLEKTVGEPAAKNTHKVYASVFNMMGVNKEELNRILKDSLFGSRIMRSKSNISFGIANFKPLLSITSGIGKQDIQYREFHSLRRGIAQRTSGSVDSKPPWLYRMLGWPKRAKPSTGSALNVEIYRQEGNASQPAFVARIPESLITEFSGKQQQTHYGSPTTFLRRLTEDVIIFLAKFAALCFTCWVILHYFLGIAKVSVTTSGSSLIDSLTDQPSWTTEKVDVTFDDVRGMDEAKAEVEEIVDYLQNPKRYERLGARLPKGMLLVGPPGTGKTLLARAIAGEADCNFFHAVGSEFDEILVGQGAKRVRELFRMAKESQPCIVFIDEIDSVGQKRTNSAIHPHANQTINQLLAEMDGFEQNQGVIVIGATNKLDNLDKALLRPGRFDVQVTVQKPDLSGRKDIFRLYLDKVIHGDINVTQLAKGTTGFTGADIENMVNQSALKAAREGAKEVTMRHLDEARDRVLMGPARIKGRLPDEEENRSTAYHEAGHAIVALFTKHANPIHKVTIIPRGSSLGHTSQLPDKDRHQVTKGQLLAELDVAMGGRVAEELIFGLENISTGASSDLRHATQVAERMVKSFGMSDRIGLRDFTLEPIEYEQGFMAERGPGTNELIDQEIHKVLQQSYDRVKDLISKRKKEHHLLAEALLEHETLNKVEIEQVLRGEKLVKAPPLIIHKQPTRRSRKQRGHRAGVGGIKKPDEDK